jgi:hypothetical protein
MFYLYSSNAEERYQRNILETLCYPERHIMRFRYEEDIVSPAARFYAEKRLPRNSRGLVIYAEIVGEELVFFPICLVEVIRIHKVGSIYFVDFRVGEFFTYNRLTISAVDILAQFRNGVEKPYPLPAVSAGSSYTWVENTRVRMETVKGQAHNQGYYLNFSATYPRDLIVGSRDFSAWENVVKVLVEQAPSMRSCVFYNIMGFYRVKRRWGIGEPLERPLPSIDDRWSTTYPLPMATRVILKMLFLKPTKSELILPQKIKVRLEGAAFAGAAEREIALTSSYNEERIELACARVLDSILAPISFDLAPSVGSGGNSSVVAPAPYILAQVKVPRSVVLIILAGLVLAPLLLSLSPDFLRDVGSSPTLAKVPWLASLLVGKATRVSEFCKLAAAIITLVVGYLGLRRLPLGK